MSDSATDSEPPSAATLAVTLGRGNEAGLLAAYDAYGPDLFAYAEFLLAGRHAEADRADQAAGAVLDALLAATGAVGDLTDPDRMFPWLLALTRNESLRRGAGAAAEDEAAELGRRGLGPIEVAALLGFAPAVLPGPVPPDDAPPDWLQAELLAAAGPEAVALRAELTRRARPFEPDGFPIPLDRRRLSGKVLAWSAAVAVVVALGLLVALPARGNAGSSAVAPAAVAEVAPPTVTADASESADGQVPTLSQVPFGSAGAASASVSPSAPATDADRRSTTPPGSTAAASPRPDPTVRQSPTAGSVRVSWSSASDSCDDTWSARLHATTGGVQVSRVTAVASRTGSTVVLHRDGGGWSGTLTGLPTNGMVTVSVSTDDGAVRPATARLRADC